MGLMSLLYFIPQGSYAENTAGSISLSPSIGGYSFDREQHLRGTTIFGLGLGYNFDENIGIEGVVNYPETKADSEISLSIMGQELSIFLRNSLPCAATAGM